MRGPPQPATCLSLFSGYGGIELGLRLAVPGLRVVGHVEREAYAAAALVARMEDESLDPAPIWDDVATFDGRPWSGRVDLIAGGFPCQDISSAGKRVGIGGSRSGLWSHMARVVREVGPAFVFVENVDELALRGLDVVLGDLAEIGFDAEWDVFRASDVGAPHDRARLFILAYASVEWLMGLPIAWTDCGSPATESYQTWLRWRGASSGSGPSQAAEVPAESAEPPPRPKHRLLRIYDVLNGEEEQDAIRRIEAELAAAGVNASIE